MEAMLGEEPASEEGGLVPVHGREERECGFATHEIQKAEGGDLTRCGRFTTLEGRNLAGERASSETQRSAMFLNDASFSFVCGLCQRRPWFVSQSPPAR